MLQFSWMWDLIGPQSVSTVLEARAAVDLTAMFRSFDKLYTAGADAARPRPAALLLVIWSWIACLFRILIMVHEPKKDLSMFMTETQHIGKCMRLSA